VVSTIEKQRGKFRGRPDEGEYDLKGELQIRKMINKGLVEDRISQIVKRKKRARGGTQGNESQTVLEQYRNSI